MPEEKPFGWKEYAEKTIDTPPRPLLVEAEKAITTKHAALDLGAGGLHDSRYLLDQGFEHVTAVDSSPNAQDTADTLPADRFSYLISSFEDLDLPEAAYDLINAQYSLPFITRAKFAPTFEKIKQALAPGGIFAGQFFGTRDSWNSPETTMTFLKREEIDELLKDIEVLKLEEEDRDGVTIKGSAKHWHLFNVLARKK